MAASCGIYADYPAAPDFRGTPAAPDLSSPDARRFRTVLRHAAAQGLNCGGHFTLATWGCGALCLTGAIIDARSGKVFFLPFSVSDARTVADGRRDSGSPADQRPRTPRCRRPLRRPAQEPHVLWHGKRDDAHRPLGSRASELLDATVALVCDVDVPAPVGRHAEGAVELAVARVDA